MSWINKKQYCLLCDMEKKTKWYKETDKFVIADNFSGNPFIIVKNHKKEISDKELENAHDLVNEIFGNHRFQIRMNLVPEHWHAHIITDKIDPDLSRE